MEGPPQTSSPSTEVYGWETVPGTYFETKVKYPVDVGYGESGEGVTPFAIWVSSKNYYWDWKNLSSARMDTLIKVQIFVGVKIEKDYGGGDIQTSWTAPPTSDFIQWSGDYLFRPAVAGTWTYTRGNIAGVSAGGLSSSFTFSTSYTPDVSENWKSDFKSQGEYAYLGKFYTKYSEGDHKFDALLKLHLINKTVKEYAEGKYIGLTSWQKFLNFLRIGKYKPYTIKITNLRFKIVSRGYHMVWLVGWKKHTPHTLFLGDKPTQDISLELVPGEVIGAQY